MFQAPVRYSDALLVRPAYLVLQSYFYRTEGTVKVAFPRLHG
ncbi:hypothetical protein [Haladaptatus sp.]